MEGRVGLGGWLHTEMVICLQAVTHRSTKRARRTVTSLIGSDALHATNLSCLDEICFEFLKNRPNNLISYTVT